MEGSSLGGRGDCQGGGEWGMDQWEDPRYMPQAACISYRSCDPLYFACLISRTSDASYCASSHSPMTTVSAKTTLQSSTSVSGNSQTMRDNTHTLSDLHKPEYLLVLLHDPSFW
ncbi:hypothetical protein N7G274_003716 [Stereocaulon virgatum]|uniref:Uncharacterized protein n=1 Tax=Stereocaulon virgatum TaxID=373712 RepID=A0ABR4AE58_9LECA